MLVRAMSDLHNEFNTFEIQSLPEDKDTILILAGDIDVHGRIKSLGKFLAETAQRFKSVLYVMGNHEYYGGSLIGTPIKIRECITDTRNVHFLEDQSVAFDDVLFVGSTLWTDFDKGNPLVMHQSEGGMNDYYKIRTGTTDAPYDRRLTAKDTYDKHITSRDYIFSTIKENKGKYRKIVVIVHHLPTYQSIPKRFAGDRLNGAFASELGDLIVESEPDLIIHGHSHDSCDYILGNVTRIVNNPYGYWNYETNPNFNPTLLIDL